MLHNMYYTKRTADTPPRHPPIVRLVMIQRDSEGVYLLVSSRRKVIRSFRSLAFLRPPNAIFVPGMYFLGFSR